MTVPLSVTLRLRKSEPKKKTCDITKHETYENPVLSLLFASFLSIILLTCLLMPVTILIIFFLIAVCKTEMQ